MIAPRAELRAFAARREGEAELEGAWAGMRGETKAWAGALWRVAISHDGARLVAVGQEPDGLVWDLAAAAAHPPRPVPAPLVLHGHTAQVGAVALPPNANPAHIALTGSHDETARIWNIETGDTVHVLRGHERGVHAVALSDPAHHLAVSTSIDRIIRLWSTATGEATAALRAPTHSVLDLALAPDASFLVSCSWNRSLRLWPLREEVRGTHRTIYTNDFAIRRVALVPGGRTLVAVDSDAKIMLWREFDAQRLPPPLPPHIDRHESGICGVTTSPAWCVAYGASELNVFSTRTSALIGEMELEGDVSTLFSAALSPRDPKVLVSVHSSGSAHVWRLWGNVEEAALATVTSPLWRCLWWRDGDHALWARVLSFAGPF
jgi:WD40 repeat protein